jgi:preprotein translocase subunit SecD
MTRGTRLALAAVIAAGLLGAGCSLPKAPCDLVIAAVDEPDVQSIPADAEILVTAADVDPAGWAVSEDGNGAPAVDLRFTPEPAKRIADHTAANVGGYLAIAVDGVVVSVPVINGPIEGGAMTISGGVDTDIVEAFGPCLPLEIRPPA